MTDLAPISRPLYKALVFIVDWHIRRRALGRGPKRKGLMFIRPNCSVDLGDGDTRAAERESNGYDSAML
jgi:hypothetical protein